MSSLTLGVLSGVKVKVALLPLVSARAFLLNLRWLNHLSSLVLLLSSVPLKVSITWVQVFNLVLNVINLAHVN